MAKTFRVKLIRGLAGTTKDQRATVKCLGLGRVQSEVVIKDNPANRGQIHKVQHLLQVVVEK